MSADNSTLEPLAYSPEKAAECIGISKATIYRLLEAKAITARRSGSRTLIDGQSLRRYYASLPGYVPGIAAPNSPQAFTPQRRRRGGQAVRS